jgi:5'-nucleotidase
MRILITNDDGIHAEGLDICEKIARMLSDDVWVIAPEYDQSGVAHSLSLNEPLRLRQVAERRFAVRGTPTDCVIMGARHLLNGKVLDLVLSGVNRGSNAGEDVIYSGTVAGAAEGTILGIPSIALSQAHKSRGSNKPYWETSLHFAPDIIRRLMANGMPCDVLVNVNFPDCPPEEVQRIAVAAQGRRRKDRSRIEVRQDGRGNPYYWIGYQSQGVMRPPDGTDLAALAERHIAITPLKIDMTDRSCLALFAGLFE